MKPRFLPAFLAALTALALPSVAAEVDETAARRALVGVWNGFAVEGTGEQPDRGPVKIQLTITEQTMKGVQFQGDKRIDHGEGTFTLGLTNQPAWLDASKPRGNNNVDAWVGIYSLQGDTLKWCVRKKDRPKEFATKDKAFLLILKRQPALPAAAAPTPAK
jgi:uncharacterized protein (TIGR03067 family)